MHPLLSAAAERQLGVFTAVDARRAGHGHEEIRVACATGAWVRLPVPSSLDPTVRLTDPGRWRTGHGFRMVRSPLAADDVLTQPPLRATRAARTLVDCAREWPLEDSVVAMDAALLARRTTPQQLRRLVGAQDRWPGIAAARRARGLADGRAESPLETRGRLRLVGADLPPTDLQVEIRAGGRLVAVVDAWYDDAAVAVEFDGRVKYTDPRRDPGRVLWEEKRREDELRALDIRVVRIADADLGTGWPTVEARARRLISTPGPAVRRFSATPRAYGVRRPA